MAQQHIPIEQYIQDRIKQHNNQIADKIKQLKDDIIDPTAKYNAKVVSERRYHRNNPNGKEYEVIFPNITIHVPLIYSTECSTCKKIVECQSICGKCSKFICRNCPHYSPDGEYGDDYSICEKCNGGSSLCRY